MGYFIMKRIALILGLLPMAAFAESDAGTTLNDTISIVRQQCSGISARMEGIKKMAGIGTAVNAVGTATGIGGVASGIVKYQTDKETIGLKREKQEIDAALKLLTDIQNSNQNVQRVIDAKELALNWRAVIAAAVAAYGVDVSDDELGVKVEGNIKSAYEQRSAELGKQIEENQKKSTAAGHARTALFAVDTATNVAGAVVSSKTIADEDLIEQIKKCKESIELLKTARMRAQIEQADKADLQAMNISQNILSKCGEYQYLDLSKLNSLAKGAVVTNSVGAVSGTVATITSALGNSKKISEMDVIGTEDAKKNMQLNMASNVIGGVTTAASLTGTALNASQIVEAKKIVNVSKECEETLKW